ncbi:MAG: PilZ domain-containing protein [Candidatus Xenobia bacterium]
MNKPITLTVRATNVDAMQIPVLVTAFSPGENGTMQYLAGITEAPAGFDAWLEKLAVAHPDDIKVAMDPRRHTRIPYNLLVTSPQLPGGNARGSDISESGIRLAVAGEVAAGKLIDLYIPLDETDTAPLRTQGQVQWSHGGEIGVQFIDLAMKDREKLRSLTH